jgi:hypothetical protein
MILGLCGTKGSGKDTAASFLIEKGWASLSFALPLKEMCATLTGLKEYNFHDPNIKDRKWETALTLNKDYADSFMQLIETPMYGSLQANLIYDAFDNVEITSPRHLLQYIGTDVVRDLISKTYWLDLMEAKIAKWRSIGVNCVITDVRFKNERDLIKDLGGKVVRIQRDTGKVDSHSSEVIDFDSDEVLENNGTIEELGRKMEAL